jgi:hypothetical protein
MSAAPARLGMVREWKTGSERRAPLTPENVRALVAQGAEIIVEPSPQRAYPDAAYVAAGARLGDPREADFLLGIKEMPLERIVPRRPHLFFSHTIKAQDYNMPLLRGILDQGATLLDHELVADERGKRLIFFGVQAGQAGMIDSLSTLGQRLAHLGHPTALAEVKQARHYEDLRAALEHLDVLGERLRVEELSPRHQPIVVGLTGRGHVAQGALEVLDALRPFEIRPEDLRAGRLPAEEPLVVVRFSDEDYYERSDGEGPFDKEHCRAHPELYRGRFEDVLRHLTLLVTGHYWDPRFPALVTRPALQRIIHEEAGRLVAIGDVTCDIEGSVASTVRPCPPENPHYVYDPATGEARDGVEGPGVAVMAVEILPTELPLDASRVFGAALLPWLEPLLACDWSRPLEELALPDELRRAVIAHAGKLSPDHAWLEAHLPPS